MRFIVWAWLALLPCLGLAQEKKSNGCLRTILESEGRSVPPPQAWGCMMREASARKAIRALCAAGHTQPSIALENYLQYKARYLETLRAFQAENDPTKKGEWSQRVQTNLDDWSMLGERATTDGHIWTALAALNRCSN